MKEIFDKLREKTERIIKEGERLLKEKKDFSTYCSKDCASCLSAEARGNIDKIDFDGSFSSREDVCMLEARDLLAERYNLTIL